jgi:hypothetical protein
MRAYNGAVEQTKNQAYLFIVTRVFLPQNFRLRFLSHRKLNTVIYFHHQKILINVGVRTSRIAC